MRRRLAVQGRRATGAQGSPAGTDILALFGQSNCEGRDATLIQPANATDSFKFDMDGRLYTYAEPGISDVNSIWPAVSHISAQTIFSSCIDRLRVLGATRRLVVVNSPKSGSLSSQWAAAIPQGSSPATIYGVARLRIQAALAIFPGARVFIGLYQGESDAILEADALQHRANWTAVLADFRAFILACGGSLGAKNTYNMRLPVTPASASPFWTTVDDQKIAHAAADSAMRLVQAADGPWTTSGNLHLNRFGMQSTGIAYANSLILDM
jgi:hypothetical protein